MKMYHSTMPNAIDAILRDGLKTGMLGISKRAETGGGYTMAGNWADEHYGTRPVYLAVKQGLYSQAARQLGLELEVEVDPRTLVADLPSLVDTGAYIEEDGMWWEDDAPPSMKRFIDADGFVLFDELLVPGSAAAYAAMRTTGTAASPVDIPPERITRLANEGALRKYVRSTLAEVSNEYGWSAGSRKEFMLDDEGMVKSDKDNTERFLKALGLMEIKTPKLTLQPDAQIFCDMDGVIANFVAGVIPVLNDILDGNDPLHFEPTKSWRKRWRRVQRDMEPDWRAATANDINIKQIRNLMFATVGEAPGPIFANLPPYNDGVSKLWPLLNSTGHTVNILTATVKATPDATSTSRDGKLEWIAAHLSPPPSEIITVQADRDGSSAEKKAHYAMRGGVPNLLIDDHPKNVDAWIAAGGYAIHHKPGKSKLTIKQLERYGL